MHLAIFGNGVRLWFCNEFHHLVGKGIEKPISCIIIVEWGFDLIQMSLFSTTNYNDRHRFRTKHVCQKLSKKKEEKCLTQNVLTLLKKYDLHALVHMICKQLICIPMFCVVFQTKRWVSIVSMFQNSKNKKKKNSI